MNIMTAPTIGRQGYWSSFYAAESASSKLMPPSQFAAFVAPEIEPECALFDIGCGNGRDSLFFAELGFKVVALDASGTAIEYARAKSEERGLTNIQFLQEDITSPALRRSISELGRKSACVYSRFFLHAITESEQAQFFNSLADTLLPGHRVAFEYRVTADQAIEKEAPPHYRRYQDSADVNAQIEALGFKALYVVEGQGFAKYKAEDAIVARCLFEKA